ncbi:hypothetical protein PRUPE_8G250700 [Prunus persica]|uniref:Uncharacterized protein n=1 Tax=Prunus persica TaxID=3760 RepID=A0A251N690_PRUPE|nr:hypothetical protein PRUPE_8G250700 [Prunus persica]
MYEQIYQKTGYSTPSLILGMGAIRFSVSVFRFRCSPPINIVSAVRSFKGHERPTLRYPITVTWSSVLSLIRRIVLHSSSSSSTESQTLTLIRRCRRRRICWQIRSSSNLMAHSFIVESDGRCRRRRICWQIRSSSNLMAHSFIVESDGRFVRHRICSLIRSSSSHHRMSFGSEETYIRF